jgi:hypothetical protein
MRTLHVHRLVRHHYIPVQNALLMPFMVATVMLR